jgi:hypothetical protein
MPFKPGDKNINRNGRKRGIPNRSTEQMKINVARAVNMGLDFLQEDYQKLRKEDPKGALNLLTKLMEFSLPKLKSVDMKAEIDQKITDITINIKRSGSNEN